MRDPGKYFHVGRYGSHCLHGTYCELNSRVSCEMRNSWMPRNTKSTEARNRLATSGIHVASNSSSKFWRRFFLFNGVQKSKALYIRNLRLIPRFEAFNLIKDQYEKSEERPDRISMTVKQLHK